MGHEVIYLLLLCTPRGCPNKYVGPLVPYHSLEECEKAISDEMGPDAPLEENGRHYYWIRDSKGSIVMRSDDFWTCRANLE